MARPVFLDVDNTLLDNDAAKAALGTRITDAVSASAARRFWELYEKVRVEEGYVDFPTTVDRLRASGSADASRIGAIVDELPYAEFVYPGAVDVIARLWLRWTVVLLSDGDPSFQRRKIERSGLAAAVRGNVLVYAHKERELDAATARFPGDRPVFVDDKAPILGHIERLRPDAVTVHVRQGSYGQAPVDPGDPAPDLEIAGIAELDGALAGQ